MATKKAPEVLPELRRKNIEADVAAYIAAGNTIEEIPSGVSSQDPQGRGKQLRLGAVKSEQKQSHENHQLTDPILFANRFISCDASTFPGSLANALHPPLASESPSRVSVPAGSHARKLPKSNDPCQNADKPLWRQVSRITLCNPNRQAES